MRWKRAALLGLCGALGVCVLLSGGCHQRPKPDTAAGFSAKPPSLRGTYGVERGGILEPVLKVDETATGYRLEERVLGEWRADPVVPHTPNEEEVRGVLGSTSTPVFGLANGTVLLLKLPAGARIGPGSQAAITRSGFVLLVDGRAVPAAKVELGSR